MPVPRWFFYFLAAVILAVAASAVFRNILGARDSWTLRGDSVFNSRTGELCYVRDGTHRCLNLRTGVLGPRRPLKRL